ncbi:hypothetical protein [Aliiroseovarius sp.]|uniref:hypothetical protein n=1 Tax=Aliiroseovarius sp. TaxID=1872442 RepID=UPI002618FAE4|nr:hypothetical protein [Aliiroseovarius sp.]
MKPETGLSGNAMKAFIVVGISSKSRDSGCSQNALCGAEGQSRTDPLHDVTCPLEIAQIERDFPAMLNEHGIVKGMQDRGYIQTIPDQRRFAYIEANPLLVQNGGQISLFMAIGSYLGRNVPVPTATQLEARKTGHPKGAGKKHAPDLVIRRTNFPVKKLRYTSKTGLIGHSQNPLTATKNAPLRGRLDH